MVLPLLNGAVLGALSPSPALSTVELLITEDPSLEIVLRISLEEAVKRGEHLQGKAREGAPLTAEQLALQLHVTELEAVLQFALDSRFARSLERAVDEDAQMIQFFQEIEARELEDRMFALGLSQPGPGTSVRPAEATSSAVRVLGIPSPVRETAVAST
jgi:hypothetical protein